MKKILIAAACVFILCLTSCASDQAPETENQIQAPQTETLEVTTEQNTSEDVTSSDSGTETDDNTEIDSNEEEPEIQEILTSEAFPEPEEIEEEVIITLEPQELIIEEESPAPVEPVEKEEPPAIIESIEIPTPEETEEPETDNESKQEPEADISEKDVVIDSNQDSDDISGGIDITDDYAESENETAETEKEIIPSRSVTLKKFEYLDVIYPGSGWIYMGLTDNSKDIAYFGRKLGTKDTKFSLQARAAGRKIIHFYRNDPLTGQYLDDYIEVIISSENGSNKTHIEAPAFTLPVQKKEKPVKKVEETSEEVNTANTEVTTTTATSVPDTTKSSTTASAPSATKSTSEDKNSQIADTPSLTESQPDDSSNTSNVSTETSANPDSLLQEAQLLYNEKEYKAALLKLNQFFEYSTDNRDEALFLKGQILEAKSDVRDIKGSIDAYTTLTKNYPASKLWDSANKRIIYLKRFYLEVR